MNVSRETLEFFQQLLGQVSLSASAPDFEEQAARVVRVRHNLVTALEVAED